MDLERIIEQLMVSDTEIIQKATKELEQALTLQGTYINLLNFMAGHGNPSYRQFSAFILKKNLSKFRDYQKLSIQVRQEIKNLIVSTIFNENDNIVRAAMIQFVSIILKHENQIDEAWVNEAMQHILNQCTLSDPQAVEIGSYVIAKLADNTPNLFIERFTIVKGLFEATLITASSGASCNISPAVIVNILTVMSALVPVIYESEDVKKTYAAAVPHIVNATNKFAADGHILLFATGLDILQTMAEIMPILLNDHVRLLIEFALAVSSNTTYDPEMRIKALNFICSLIGEKKKALLKLKLIEPILNVMFNIMSSEPESDDADEFFIDSEIETPLASATVVIDKLATKFPPEKFIPPLLSLLEIALNNPDELRRRSAYIMLATIAEGCKEAICDKYLEPMLNILKQGLNDPAVSVRNAALFAVGQFSEQLQPEINEYANDVLPLLFKHMEDIMHAEKTGQKIDAKCGERVFYALEAFCDSMEDNLAPYMENLMCMILTLLSENYPERLKILAMALSESAAKAYKGSLLPWFQPLIEKIRPYMVEASANVESELRSQAIETLAAIARNIGKQFLPFALETMQESVIWIESTDDIDVRRSVINLFGALAAVVGDDLAPVLPKILDHINACIIENAETIPQLERVPPPTGGAGAENYDEKDEIDLESESITSSSAQFYGDNPYSEAKIRSVDTIKELAESCIKILIPYAQDIYGIVYKMIDNISDNVRKSSIEAAKTFTIAWNQECPNDDNAKHALQILLTKYKEIILKDEQSEVVIEAQESVSDILSDLGVAALPTKESRDSIAHCIKQGLTYKYACLFTGDTSDDESHEEGDSESDQYVIECAANLLAALGKAVAPEEFSEYFKALEPYIMKHIENVNEGEIQVERGQLIGVLAECYSPLGKNVAPYFVKHYKMMLRDSKRRNPKTRQNAIFGLGELMRAGNEQSFGYFPEVLQTLSEVLANEKKRIVVDNIIGALARLMLTNAVLVPLQQVLPVMLQKLPIVEDEVESAVVMQCFNLLYTEIPETMQAHTGAIVSIAVQSISKPYCDKTVVKRVVKLMQTIRSIYPYEYQQALANEELHSILPAAQENASGQL